MDIGTPTGLRVASVASPVLYMAIAAETIFIDRISFVS
jgi:hypothetical protein